MATFPKGPKVIVFFSSYRCDSRCTMCYTWVKQQWAPELSLEKIDEIFSDPILGTTVQIVNMTGGEPTARPDMVSIVKILLNRCRGLRRIDLPTNGINTEEVIDKIQQILALLLPTRVRLAVTVSMDGVGEVHEKVRGVKDIFCKVERTLQELKVLSTLYGSRISLGLNTTIGRLNYAHAQEMLDYAQRQSVGINFTPAAISEVGVESIQMEKLFVMDQEVHESVARFYEQLATEGVIKEQYRRFVTTWLRTGKRIGGCAFREGKTVLLEPEGNVYLCGNFKEYVFGNLLKEPFSQAWKRAIDLQRNSDWHQCQTCPSNCYFDEAKQS